MCTINFIYHVIAAPNIKKCCGVFENHNSLDDAQGL